MKGKEINIDKTAFSEGWWVDFLDHTNIMTRPLKINNVLDRGTINNLYEIIPAIIRNSILTNKFRAYCDGTRYSNDSITKELPYSAESIDQWIGRIFTNRRFGMIINQCEQLSDLLSQELLSYLAPLKNVMGSPLLGYNITIFLGNYGFTPLGIHQDGPGNNVLHLHLGPHEKIMYNWEPNELTAKEMQSLDIEKLKPLAVSYEINSGDLYYMPWDMFHIGYTDKFSIGITLWFNNPTKSSYISNLFSRFLVENLQESDLILPFYKERPNESENAVTKSLCTVSDGIQVDTFESILVELHNMEQKRIESNGRWYSNSLIDNSAILAKDDLNKVIKLVSPYKIMYSIKGDQLVLFMRGHTISLSKNEEIVEIIELLNRNEPITLKDIVANCKTLTPREFIVILTEWYQKKAIHLE